MRELVTLAVEPEDAGKRADVFVAENLEDTSRAMVQKRMEQGLVQKDGRPVRANLRLKAGDVLTVELPEPEPLEIAPENIPLDVVYEDGDLLVVNKPQGMVVHPAAGHTGGTLVNALLYHCGDSLSGINGVLRPGIVHRIDKDTSGLLVVAKNDAAHAGLARQLAEHSMTRRYRAVALGYFQEAEGTVDAPLGRSPKDRKKMAIVREPLPGAGAPAGVFVGGVPAGNRAYPSDTGAFGFPWPSAFGGHGLRQPKTAHGADGAGASCHGAGLLPSPDGRIYGVFGAFAGEL